MNLSVLKAGFRKCHRRPQHRLPLGCEPRERFKLTVSYDVSGIHNLSRWHTSCQTRFTRGRVRELKNAHNSVTVQNRTHVYMNFFDHKTLGNHLLQLCPEVVKHPVFVFCLFNVLTIRNKQSSLIEFQIISRSVDQLSTKAGDLNLN